MRNLCSSCQICFALLFLLSPTAHSGELYSTQQYLTGDWGGNRTKLNESGVHIGLSYTAEPAASVSGGFEQESTYLHNINAELKLDLTKLISLPKTRFLAKYSSRSGDNLSEDHVVPAATDDGRYLYGEYYNKSQEAFGGQTTKLVNFQLTTQFTDDLSLDYGRLVMNDLFLRSDLYCNFMNNAICGSPKGVFTPYSLNAYPDATAGVHTSFKAGEMVQIKAGVFDGGWTEQDKNGWDWTLGENGMAIAAELQFYFNRDAKAGVDDVVKIGVNHHTGDFQAFDSDEIFEGQTSFWVLTDWMLYREEHSDDQGLAAFGSIVINTDDEISALPVSFTAGCIYKGLVPTRDRDKLGLMLTYAEHSEFNTYTHDFVAEKERGNETLVELTYNMVLGYGLELMPSIQYISNPNGSKDFSNVTVLGLKLNVNL